MKFEVTSYLLCFQEKVSNLQVEQYTAQAKETRNKLIEVLGEHNSVDVFD